MKLHRSVLLVLIFCTLLFNACSKSNGPDNKLSAQYISLKVDGVLKSSTAPTGSYYQASDTSIYVIGTFGTEQVTILIEHITVGTFEVATVRNEAIVHYISTNGAAVVYDGIYGSVTIDSYSNGAVTGTFSFTTRNQEISTSKVITEGKFQVNLPPAQIPL